MERLVVFLIVLAVVLTSFEPYEWPILIVLVVVLTKRHLKTVRHMIEGPKKDKEGPV